LLYLLKALKYRFNIKVFGNFGQIKKSANPKTLGNTDFIVTSTGFKPVTS
jgi:hypothetical protein